MLKKNMLRLFISIFVLLILYSNLIGLGLLNLTKSFSNPTLGTITYHFNRISSRVNRLPYNQKIFIESSLIVNDTEAAIAAFYTYIRTNTPEYISNDNVLRKCMVLALKYDKDVYHEVVDNWVSDYFYFIDLIITSETSTVEDFEFALKKVNELMPHSEHQLILERLRNDLIELIQQNQ